MIVIGLFFPALITIGIRRRRNAGEGKGFFPAFVEYGKAVLFCNLFTMIIITYILKIDGVEITAFHSFSFFTKYALIAVCYSAFLPYLEEIVKKCFQIKFTVEGKNKKGESNENHTNRTGVSL